MPKIVYLTPAAHVRTGGNKAIFRHVEALRAAGFEAVVRVESDRPIPTWFDHQAPVERADTPIAPDDVLVAPDDDPPTLRACAARPNRRVMLVQNPYRAVANGAAQLEPGERAAYRTYLTCSHGVAAWIARHFDYELISVAPGFADERVFVPAEKAPFIAVSPRKRPTEYLTIRHIFERHYAGPSSWRWAVLERLSEAEVAHALGRASVYLSLARLEGMSMSIVEAMACGCLVAGFTGLGTREYASSINGLWVEEDDCEAAAFALLRAVAIAEANAGEAALMRHAARATAAQWSHAAFTAALTGFWRDFIGRDALTLGKPPASG